MKNYIFIGVLLSFLATSPATAHEWMAPAKAASRQNPIPTTAESILRGEKLYLNSCAYCHGDNGRGMSADEAGLQKSPPNLVERLNNHTDGDFFWKIQHGRDEMPAFKDDLQDADIWNIINFIKSRKDSE